jgi:hypothetical protein
MVHAISSLIFECGVFFGRSHLADLWFVFENVMGRWGWGSNQRRKFDWTKTSQAINLQSLVFELFLYHHAVFPDFEGRISAYLLLDPKFSWHSERLVARYVHSSF